MNQTTAESFWQENESEDFTQEEIAQLERQVKKDQIQPSLKQLRELYRWSDRKPNEILHSHSSANTQSKWRTAWFTVVAGHLEYIEDQGVINSARLKQRIAVFRRKIEADRERNFQEAQAKGEQFDSTVSKLTSPKEIKLADQLIKDVFAHLGEVL